MSGDVQPRKRKDKKRKKEDVPEDVGSTFTSEENIHVQKDSGTGGNPCAKIVFFFLLSVLLVLIGLIITEHRGSTDLDTPILESRWAPVFEGWLDDSPAKHDEHEEAEAGPDHDEHEDHDEHGEAGHEEEDEDHEEEEGEEEEEEAVSGEGEEGEGEAAEKEAEDAGDEEDEKGEEDEDDEGQEDEEEADEEEQVGIPGVAESTEDGDNEDEAEDEAEDDEDADAEATSQGQDDDGDDDNANADEDDDDDDNAQDDEDEEGQEDDDGDDGEDDNVPGSQEEPEDNEIADDDNDDADDENADADDENADADDENADGADDDDDEEGEATGAKKPAPAVAVKPAEKKAAPADDDDDDDDDNATTQTRGSNKPKAPGGQSKIIGDDNEDDDNDADDGGGDDDDDDDNADDWVLRSDLDLADANIDDNPDLALQQFTNILKKHPHSPRTHYGKARALDRISEKKRSNSILDQAIEAYENVLNLATVGDKLFMQAAERCIDRMRFRGHHMKAVRVHKSAIARFPDDPSHPNQLAVTYLMTNRALEAKKILEETLQRWPENGFAQVHYGFILKTTDNNMVLAVEYLQKGIVSREPGTIDGKFFFQLGDALMRLGRKEEAMKVYELGVKEGLFLSKYQRSLYNVDRLLGRPWWTPEETTYASYFKKLVDNWKVIKAEGLKALYNTSARLYRDEAENLKDFGQWKQFELFTSGRRITGNCAMAPVTCQLIDGFPAARDCRRGQVKFSVIDAGTHVWPHCGPTNCRLRAHLGLVVPPETFLRVAEETRSWEEGKLFIFDDSFEHEVWHNGTSTRLVLIIDVWHPELTAEERRTLPSI